MPYNYINSKYLYLLFLLSAIFYNLKMFGLFFVVTVYVTTFCALFLSEIFIKYLIKINKNLHRKRQIFAVDGNIGSGKTTLIKIIQNKFDDVVVLEEPLSEWQKIKDDDGKNLLDKFYNDKVRWSYTFQNFAYITRLKKMMDELSNVENNNKVIICERSILTDKNIFAKMLYDKKLLTKFEYEIYNYWFDIFEKKYHINNIIYLKVDPDISFKRINIRNRSEEKNISKEYVKDVHSYHEKWFNEVKDLGNKNVLTLNGNTNFINNENDKKVILNKIRHFIKISEN